MTRCLKLRSLVAWMLGLLLLPAELVVAQESPRGVAKVEETRPARFPHRIWAACDFEAQEYDWFGPTVTENLDAYPGNATAMGPTTRFKNSAAVTTGLNPVPGPMMGKENFLYLRYKLTGATEATFQHFSLSSNDNNHLRLSGMTEGKWSEAVMNFSKHGRRNDGKPGVPFKEGERMDDLKIFVGRAGDGKRYDLAVDDIVFFANDPNLPPEPEPFPRRVLFLAAFDTGIDSKWRDKYWPGKYDVARASQSPAGSYWSVAKSVPTENGSSRTVDIEMKPPRIAGERTKLRFRYHLTGATRLAVALGNAAEGKLRTVVLPYVKVGAWSTQYVDFSQGEASLPLGHRLDRTRFAIEPEAAEEAVLYIDEVVLYDAYPK